MTWCSSMPTPCPARAPCTPWRCRRRRRAGLRPPRPPGRAPLRAAVGRPGAHHRARRRHRRPARAPLLAPPDRVRPRRRDSRDVYRRIGGHGVVRAEVAEDLALARVAAEAGVPVRSLLGGDLTRTACTPRASYRWSRGGARTSPPAPAPRRRCGWRPPPCGWPPRCRRRSRRPGRRVGSRRAGDRGRTSRSPAVRCPRPAPRALRHGHRALSSRCSSPASSPCSHGPPSSPSGREGAVARPPSAVGT